MSRRYKPIPQYLHEKLKKIVPSQDYGIRYFPCMITLKNGQQRDYVYIVEQQSYINNWGVYPENDSGKSSILIDDIIDLKESPSRLPPIFANEIYEGGETGMGYTIFTVVFNDGSRKSFLAGNAIDFITYPEGKSQADIKEICSGGRDTPNLIYIPDYYWCIYTKRKTN